MDGNKDMTELNRAFFNDEAANYDVKHEKATSEMVRRIEARRAFIGVQWIEDESTDDDDDDDDDDHAGSAGPSREVRLLDYACGTGAMTRALAPYTTQCIGIDLSENMVDTYNARARNQGLSGDEVMAYHGNLCVPDDEDPAAFRHARFYNFDVACVGLGFHHFDEPALAARRLVARLRPGGVLMIIDFLVFSDLDLDRAAGHHHHHHHHDDDDDGHQHAHGGGGQQGHSHDGEAKEEDDADDERDRQRAIRTVTHHGFSEAHMHDIFARAGAGKDFAMEKMGEVVMGPRHGKRDLFLARGTKAA